MTKAQNQAHKLPRKSQKDRVWDYLIKYPGMQVSEIGKALAIVDSTITARLNDLEREGKVYKSEVVEDGKHITLYRPETNPAQWPVRADEFKRENHPVTKFYRKVDRDGFMTLELRTQLVNLFKSTNPKDYEHQKTRRTKGEIQGPSNQMGKPWLCRLRCGVT
jgi:predicted DNA-binding transcriptional regulator